MGVIHVLGAALALLVNAHRWDGVDRPFVVQPGGRIAPLVGGANLVQVRRSPDGRFIAGLARDWLAPGAATRRAPAAPDPGGRGVRLAPDSRRFVVVRGRARRHVQVVGLAFGPPRELTPPDTAAMPRSRYGKVLWDPAGRWIGYYRDSTTSCTTATARSTTSCTPTAATSGR